MEQDTIIYSSSFFLYFSHCEEVGLGISRKCRSCSYFIISVAIYGIIGYVIIDLMDDAVWINADDELEFTMLCVFWPFVLFFVFIRQSGKFILVLIDKKKQTRIYGKKKPELR